MTPLYAFANYVGEPSELCSEMLETTPSVIIRREPLMRDAKAYLTAKETHNLELLFGDSPDSRRVRMSSIP
ncbi:hypothetical protein [Halorutilus salinus]|uniref:hypothetical protein n=1 Tax=Halorutilus salinus TaxID=2487751 RepID=UPI00224B112C|nr:hypothetical protein [Halorutilus salinus]